MLILLNMFHDGNYLLCVMGWKFSKIEKVFVFVFTQHRNDTSGNVYNKVMGHPEIARIYLQHTGVIGYHKKPVSPETQKIWKIQDPRIPSATVLDMYTVDVYRPYKNKLSTNFQPLKLLEFTEILPAQLLNE